MSVTQGRKERKAHKETLGHKVHRVLSVLRDRKATKEHRVRKGRKGQDSG